MISSFNVFYLIFLKPVYLLISLKSSYNRNIIRTKSLYQNATNRLFTDNYLL